jgi:hypothetical protein
LKPGAIFWAIKHASIAIVPEPQNGSIKGVSPVQLASLIKLAAKVSLIGASPCASLYPLLFKPEPEVSIVNKALSFKIDTSIGYLAPVSFSQPLSL